MKDAEDGLAFPSEVARLLDWAECHLAPSNDDATAFGIFRPGGKQALGLCEIVIHRRSTKSKWVKMLRLHLRPHIDADLQRGSSQAAMDVFVASLVGAIALQSAHKASTLKVYARTSEQLNFLRALVTQVSERVKRDNLSLKASIEGRFLVVEATARH